MFEINHNQKTKALLTDEFLSFLEKFTESCNIFPAIFKLLLEGIPRFIIFLPLISSN